MKFTTLFGAAALVAALGATAHAVPATVASDDFEYEETGPVAEINAFSANAKWAVASGDTSKIVTTHFDGRGQALELATDGNLLQFNAGPTGTTQDYEVTIEMKVEMVASDTPVDMSSDTTSHAAVYLYKPEGADSGTLKAFGYDAPGGTNKWYDLTAQNFALDDKDTADIKIVINYVESTATYTVNGTEFDSVPLANPTAWESTHKLSSVAFQGTGFVDDLFIKEEQVGTYVDFIYEIAQGATTNVESTVQKNIESAFQFDDLVDPVVGYTASVALYSCTNGEETFIDNVPIVHDDNENSDSWSIDESTTQYTDAVDAYVVRLTYTLKQSTVYRLVAELSENGTFALPETAELEIEFRPGDALLHLFSDASGEGGVQIRYDDAAREITVDRGHMRVTWGEEEGFCRTRPLENRLAHLRIYIDRSSIEIFVNDGDAVFTSRVFPEEGEHFARVEADAFTRMWTLKPAVKDRFLI